MDGQARFGGDLDHGDGDVLLEWWGQGGAEELLEKHIADHHPDLAFVVE